MELKVIPSSSPAIYFFVEAAGLPQLLLPEQEPVNVSSPKYEEICGNMGNMKKYVVNMKK